MSMILDVGMQSGHAGFVPVAGNKLSGLIGLAGMRYGRAAAQDAHYDSGGARVISRVDALDEFRRQNDAAHLRAIRAAAGRTDAVGEAGGTPRDFEFLYPQDLEETRAPLAYMDMMQMDTRVPLGARTFRIRRRTGSGEAAFTRGGTQDFPTVSTGIDEEVFNTAYIVAAVEIDYLKGLSYDYEGINQAQDDLRMADRVVNEAINRLVFEGRSDLGLPGILDYPGLSKYTSPTAFTGTADELDVLAELDNLCSIARIDSGGAFPGPNRLRVSLRMGHFLRTRRLSGTAAFVTLAEAFLQTQPANGIRVIEECGEFDGAGPGGIDVAFAYNDAIEATRFTMIQPPTILPAHEMNAMVSQVLTLAAVGPVVMPDVGGNVLMYCQTQA